MGMSGKFLMSMVYGYFPQVKRNKNAKKLVSNKTPS